MKNVFKTVIGLLLAMLITACGNNGLGEELDDHATRHADGRETAHFSSLVEMTRASDLVVKARVTEVEAGRTVGEDVDAPITFRDVSLEIDEVLFQKGQKVAEGATVTVEEEGWDANGVGYEMNSVAWSRVGDAGYFYLKRKTDVADGNAYRLVHSSGRALIGASPDERSSQPATYIEISGDESRIKDGPWSFLADLEKTGEPSLSKAIRSAAATAEAGGGQ